MREKHTTYTTRTVSPNPRKNIFTHLKFQDLHIARFLIPGNGAIIVTYLIVVSLIFIAQHHFKFLQFGMLECYATSCLLLFKQFNLYIIIKLKRNY